MEIGISIDTDSIYKYYNTIYQNCDIIKHIQFYLNDEPIDMQRSKIIKFKEDFKFASFSYSIHSYGYINLCEPINRVRKSWIDVALETLLLVNDIQGVFANFHMGFSFSDKVPNDFMLGNLKDSIMELSKYATSKNIFIDLENDFNTNEIIRLGSNINDLNEIISWNLSNIKLCYDIGHANIAFDTPYEYRKYIESIQSFHIHNNFGDIDQHLAFGSAGDIQLNNVYEELSSFNKLYFILENDRELYDIALTNLRIITLRV